MNGLRVKPSEGITEGDFRIFIGMDENAIKAAFKEWLYRVAKKNGWVDKSDRIVTARVAEHFQVSRQTVTNWLAGTSCLSTQKVNEVIAPTMKTTASAFWHEMQIIDRELKGLDTGVHVFHGGETKLPSSAEEVLSYIKILSVAEKIKMRKLYLASIAEGEL